MSKQKFHISVDGIVRECHAKIQCRLGGPEEHFDNREDAQVHADKINKEGQPLLPKVGSFNSDKLIEDLDVEEAFEAARELRNNSDRSVSDTDAEEEAAWANFDRMQEYRNEAIFEQENNAYIYEREECNRAPQEFINERYPDVSLAEKTRLAKGLSKRLWDKTPKAYASKVPKVTDYVIYGYNMSMVSKLHRDSKADPSVMEEHRELENQGVTTRELHYYNQAVKDYNIDLNDGEVNIYAVDGNSMDLPGHPQMVSTESFEADWGGLDAGAVNDKLGYLSTKTRYDFYQDDIDDLIEERDNIINNRHMPIKNWVNKPETIAVQDNDGRVSIYNVHYDDEDGRVENIAEVSIRGTNETVKVNRVFSVGVYTGKQAQELIEKDLVFADIETI